MRTNRSIYKIVAIIAFHLLFWVGVYFFYNFFLGYGSQNTAYVNRFSLYLMPITIGVSYFFLYSLIPNYLLNKKQGLFILYSIYTFIISSFLIVLSILYGLVFSLELNSDGTAPLTKTFPFIIFGVYLVVMVVILLGMVYYNYSNMLKDEDLKSKFLETQLQLKEQELKFLKMQIHPHFLFNSLNTIYGFALTKRDEAPDMILKLSSLLDYILYQVDKPSVLLMDEINHVKDYISLEKTRFRDQLMVNFNQDFETSDIQIAPMLLIPFVENSFKHGSVIDEKLLVNISINITEKELIFSVENSTKNKNTISEGIGLQNIQKRLEMLYPDNYMLDISIENQTYKVVLKINLIALQNG